MQVKKGCSVTMNDAQRQLNEQRARNLADMRAEQQPDPTDAEVDDGRYAYAAYGATSGAGDTTWDGRPMPGWDDMGDQQRAGWIAVGRAFVGRSQ